MQLEDDVLYTPEQVCEFGCYGPDTTPGAIRKAAARGLIEFTRYPPTPHGRIYQTAANVRANQAAGLCLANSAGGSPARSVGRRKASRVAELRPGALAADPSRARKGRRAAAS